MSMHVWRRRADTQTHTHARTHTHLLDLLLAQLVLFLLCVQEGGQLLLLLGHNLLLELLLIGQHRLHLGGGTRLLEQREPLTVFFLPFLHYDKRHKSLQAREQLLLGDWFGWPVTSPKSSLWKR